MDTAFHYIIKEYNQLTSNIVQLFLIPIAKKINYLAGQYLEILYSDGTYHPFSIANIYNAEGLLELHIKIIECDSALHNTLLDFKKTKKLTLRGPFGQAYYRHDKLQDKKKVIVLAGGTGFAYAKAIIEQAIQCHDHRNIYFYWSVRLKQDYYLLNFPEAIWPKKLAHFEYISVLSESKTYADTIIVKQHPDLIDCVIYASGPKKMIQNGYQLFLQHGLSKNAMYSDFLLLSS